MSADVLAVLLAIAVVVITIMTMVLIRQRRAEESPGLRLPETIGILLLPVASLVLVAWLMGFLDADNGRSITRYEERLPLLMTGGVVVLLLGLVATAVVFGALKLTDGTEALGLPKGSVRAVIALSLILIFAIMSVFLYIRTASPTLIVQERLTQAQVDQIPAREIRNVTATTAPGASPNASPVYNVSRILSDDTANQLAQQLLTTISTLVVAIAAFYFGTSSVQTAQAASGERKVSVSSQDPKTVRKSGTTYSPVRVRVKTSPEGLEVNHAVFGDPSGELRKTGAGEYEYKADKPEARVLLRFALAIDPDVAGQWELALEKAEATDKVTPTRVAKRTADLKA